VCDDGFQSGIGALGNGSDGCSNKCTVILGFYCTVSVNLTSSCRTICGDGIEAGS
jgi:hypothetical protein